MFIRFSFRFLGTRLTSAFGVFLLIAAILVATPTVSAEPPVLQGTVVDQAGNAVANVTVTIAYLDISDEQTTSASGEFQFRIGDEAAEGTVATLTARAPDQRIWVGQVTIRPQTIKPMRLTVTEGRDLAVSVRDADGRPVAHAEVEFISKFRPLAAGKTDSAGQWRTRVPAEEKDWAIYARKSGIGFDYATASRGRSSKADPHPLPVEVTLTLDGARTTRVKAVDANNKPISGVKIGTWYLQKVGYEADINLSGTKSLWQTTGDDGTVTLDWLPKQVERSWPIMYRSDDYFALDHAFFIPADKPVEDFTITLLAMEELSGRVTHADGRPAEGITVSTEGHGAGQNTFRRGTRTDSEGRYKFKAFSEFAYVLAVSDDEWAAPYQAGIVVRAEKPVTGVDFVLTKPTRVHGRVTVGATSQPASKATVNALIDKGQIPPEIRRAEDRFYRTVTMSFFSQTDADGQYQFLLGPGEYRLQGPARTKPITITVPATGGGEIVNDFSMPRPESGSLAIRVVDSQGHPVAGATLSGTYTSNQARRLFTPVKTDSTGMLKTERSLDPLVLHAITADKQLAGIIRSEAEQTEVKLVVGPLATASGRLLDLQGQPVAQKEITYAINIYKEPERRMWTPSFGGKVTTDAEGRFTFLHLVPGQLYEGSVKIDENSSRRVVKAQPDAATALDLGDIKADTEAHKPYVPPTPAETTIRYFATKPNNTPRERLNSLLIQAERAYTRPLLLFGAGSDKACIDLFRLFEQRSDILDKENPTASELRWEFELMALDDSRPGARELVNELQVFRDNSVPTLAVLNTDGQLAATLPLQLHGDKLDASAVAHFLKTHKRLTRDAEKLLAVGLSRAQADNKRVFLIFSASWCGPCAMLMDFLARNKDELEKHYVFVKLDVSRDEHAEQLRAKFKESKSGGVPWYTILDAQGQMLVTSNAPTKESDAPFNNSNIGFPSEKEGIDHFLTMLKSTAPRLSLDALEAIRADLNTQQR